LGLQWRRKRVAKFVLHPLIHTLLKFTVAQDIGDCQGKGIKKENLHNLYTLNG
jgi:hypothetical protein